MNNYCENCKYARLWTDGEKLRYMTDFYNSVGSLPFACNHYICGKIPKGKEWTDAETGNTYSYDGYSLEGECYDDVFHCFEEGDNDPN